MAGPTDNPSMAVFCDFENVALGVRDAKYDKFDIKRVLERLLLKGSIVVKKAYCDWERYKAFKATMHEASFELIEIPHVRQSGKNSADIRLVVDALDLCYTKSHVDTFVIISGDSDFSPLVSKLRENAKQVIGVGVKQSTSDLLIANCDEFIFYDDLVRESQRGGAPARRGAAEPPAAGKRPAEDDGQEASRRKEDSREDAEARRRKALDMALETFEALMAERGASGRIWASVLKDAIKRRKPDFNEARYGFRTFGSLLDEAQARGLLEVGRDEKSNTYVRRASGGTGPAAAVAAVPAAPLAEASPPATPRGPGRRSGRAPERRRDPVPAAVPMPPVVPGNAPAASVAGPVAAPPAPAPAEPVVADEPARPARAGRKTAGKKAAKTQPVGDPALAPEAATPSPKKPPAAVRKTAGRKKGPAADDLPGS